MYVNGWDFGIGNVLVQGRFGRGPWTDGRTGIIWLGPFTIGGVVGDGIRQETLPFSTIYVSL